MAPRGACLKKLDERLGYNTVKFVQVKDWRLGLMHYSIFLIALLYAIIYGLVSEKGYNKYEYVTSGSVVANSLPGVPRYGDRPYCCDPKTQTCPQPTADNPNPTLVCIYWDEDGVEYPRAPFNSLLMTTRVGVKTIVRNNTNPGCNGTYPLDNNCPWVQTKNTKMYIADIERFTIRIRHGLSTKELNQSGANSGMAGRLLDQQGNVIRSWPNESLFDNNPILLQSWGRDGDYVYFWELVKATGIDLDAMRDPGNPTSSTVRYDGLSVLCYIEYNLNSSNGLEYTYYMKDVSNLEYKVESSLNDPSSTTRTVLDRHGFRFVFTQTGKVGKFDFVSTVVTLMTATAVVSVGSILVDFIATRLLGIGTQVRSAKYEAAALKGKSVDMVDPHDEMIVRDPTQYAAKTDNNLFNQSSSLEHVTSFTAYVAKNDGELSFPAGAHIFHVTHQSDGMMEGEYEGKRGRFPNSAVMSFTLGEPTFGPNDLDNTASVLDNSTQPLAPGDGDKRNDKTDAAEEGRSSKSSDTAPEYGVTML